MANRFVATIGNDADPGTEAMPWATFGKAMGGSGAVAGDTVRFANGAYNETGIIMAASGTSSSNLITFKATNSRLAILNGDGEGSDAPGIDQNGQEFLRIEGFETRNHGKSGIINGAQGNVFDKNTLQFVDLWIHDNGATHIGSSGDDGSGLTLTNVLNLTIDNCLIHDCGDHAIFFTGNNGFRTVLIRNCTSFNNKQDFLKTGFNSGATQTNWVIEFNDLGPHFGSGHHEDALSILQVNGLDIRSNTFRDFTQHVYMPVKDDALAVVENARIYSNVYWSDAYADEGTGNNCPHVFCDAGSAASSICRNYDIYSNTFGFAGYDAGSGGTGWGIRLAGDIEGTWNVYNNLFSDARAAYPDVIAPATFGIDYNGYFKPDGRDPRIVSWAGATYDTGDLADFTTDTGHEANGIEGDPSFVDRANFDYRLQPDSIALGAGHPDLGSVVTLPATFLDRLGNVRNPFGGTLGAFEGSSVQPPAPRRRTYFWV